MAKILQETEEIKEKIEDRPEDVEVQTTFNEESLEVLVEEGTVENVEEAE